MKRHINDFAWPYGVILGFILLMASVFWVAIDEDKERQKCIDSGYVYIEHYCYKNLREIR